MSPNYDNDDIGKDDFLKLNFKISCLLAVRVAPLEFFGGHRKSESVDLLPAANG